MNEQEQEDPKGFEVARVYRTEKGWVLVESRFVEPSVVRLGQFVRWWDCRNITSIGNSLFNIGVRAKKFDEQLGKRLSGHEVKGGGPKSSKPFGA